MSIDLLYNELENDLRGTVRDLLKDRLETARVSAMYDGDRSAVAGLWKGLAADLGLAGLLVPEELGGAGASAREAAVVLEELGRAVAPVPYFTSSVLATTVLLDPAVNEAGRMLLAELAAGEKVAALAVPFTTAPHGPLAQTAGRVSSVAGAIEADVLLVPVNGSAGLELRAVPVDEASVEPVVSLDMSRQLADVAVAASAGEVVLSGPSTETAIRRGLLVGAGLLASEQFGVAQWGFTTTLEYLKVRRQFGRVVGGYQAIKHRLADLYVGVEQLGAAARYAAGVLAAVGSEQDGETHIAVSVAASYAGDVAVHTLEEAVQLHGGIGMTWEHPAHLYLKRAKADQIALGTPGMHRVRLAEVVDLGL